MFQSPFKHLFSIVLLAVLLVGCSAPEPYVWRPYTIDREHVNFPDGPTLKSGSEFSICYAKRGTTPAALKQMADEECGRFGMSATFARQNLGVCPLATPTAAQFACGGGAGQVITQSPNQLPGSLLQSSGPDVGSRSVLPSSAFSFNAEDVSTTAKSVPYPTYLFNGQSSNP